MTRPALLAILVLSLAPTAARAQNNTSRDTSLGFFMVATALPALAFDICIVSNLFDDGLVRKGFGINAVIFGAVALASGALAGLVLFQDTSVKGWPSAAVGLAVFGAGTTVLGVWGLTHSRPPEGSPPFAPPPAVQDPSFSPPPPPPPASVHLMPQFGVTPHGGFVFGLAGTL